MNIKSSYYFQVHEYKKPVLIYYLVLICVYTMMLINNIEMVKDYPGSSSSLGGMNVATAIFLFISSLTDLKGNLGMMLQNGVSRRTLFLGRILNMTTVSLFLSIVEFFILIAFQLIASASADNVSVHGSFSDYYRNSYTNAVDSPSHHLVYLILNLVMFLFFMAAGYLFTLILYRVNRAVSIALCIGIPIIYFIILPVMDKSMNGAVGDSLDAFFDLTLGAPLNAFLSFTIAAILCTSLSWLPLRRISMKP